MTETNIKPNLKKEDILKNPLEEYFKNNIDKDSTFQELFEATPQNVDLRTDLNIKELVILNKIKMNCIFLDERIKTEVYQGFFNQYLRLKISKDRLSRAEFVDINRRERFEQNLQKFGNFKALADIKK